MQYMKSHVYGNPPHDVSMSDDPQVLKMYKEPLPKGRQHVHALACKAHEPGLVSVDSKERRYCFGGAKLPGERVCDAKANDYTQLHDKYVLHIACPRVLLCFASFALSSRRLVLLVLVNPRPAFIGGEGKDSALRFFFLSSLSSSVATCTAMALRRTHPAFFLLRSGRDA